ncbi:hypothetical protein ACP4OV_026121 [Aristida adscensionis]
MGKLLCVVLLSSLLLLATLVSASSSPKSSLSKQHAQVLGRKGRELGQMGHHYHHEDNHMQQTEGVALGVKKPAETKEDWTGQGEDSKEGLIYSSDYSAVAMHAGSPPKRKHPKP